MIAPLVYFMASVPGFIYAVVLTAIWVVAGSPVEPWLYTPLYLSILPMVLVPLFMRKLTRTYGYFAGIILVCSTMVMSYLADTTEDAWNWVGVGVWSVLLSLHLVTLWGLARARGMTGKQLLSLDSLSIVLRRN